jgi:hypothetical protein
MELGHSGRYRRATVVGRRAEITCSQRVFLSLTDAVEKGFDSIVTLLDAAFF